MYSAHNSQKLNRPGDGLGTFSVTLRKDNETCHLLMQAESHLDADIRATQLHPEWLTVIVAKVNQ
jgi:hypothetical protein